MAADVKIWAHSNGWVMKLRHPITREFIKEVYEAGDVPDSWIEFLWALTENIGCPVEKILIKKRDENEHDA